MGWVVGIGDWRFLELKIKMMFEMFESWQTIKFSLYFFSLFYLWGENLGRVVTAWRLSKIKLRL